ncbi:MULTISPECIES: ATP-binding cassette domain-containing protein [Oceanobacillus]|uniref:ATP-binding cassette domain-containing protein n=1 Tax=Oceanobacillus aidingensis TaxID=645964 RepID=A0ABV9JYP3_9BACI|nr:ABC transporter ATP-binding protein [Oceanobacillus oncorhynchi]MDM8100348.1 ABC transporter ATP-binding protein [Oceanobacillus oncorhynchi]UUI40839.1 ABC transporter ATP-binding protein [Oceanobacillus oncorhynchi]
MSYAIEAKDVSVRYKDFTAIDQVSFQLESGKIHGLLGRNGAGKTSLLSVLSAFRKTDTGNLIIDGEDPFENPRIMQDTIFIFDQHKDLEYSYDKVGETLKEMAYFRPNFDETLALQLAEKFKLPLNKKVNQLSKGKKSAFQAIIGLASRAPLTIFDEAYLGMDAPTRETFYNEILNDQEKHPRTIIFSTHLVSETDYLFDEVLMIHNGKVLLQDTNEQVISKGFSITGSLEQVDDFTKELEVLNSQLLGGTKSVMVYGELSEQQKNAANQAGLDIGPLSLHDLFVHLTKEEKE